MADQELQIKITTTADTSGVEKASDAISGVGEAARGAAAGQVTFLGALGQQQKEAENASASLGDTARAAIRANQAFQGLERGGIGGTVRAFRGLVGLLRTGLISGGGGLGAGVGAIFAPFLVAMIEMRRRFNENVAEMKATWQGLQDNADRYKLAITQITAETDKMREATMSDLEDIASEYDKLRERQTQGEKRSSERNKDLREKERAELGLSKEQALAAAKTPEERARIEQDFTRRGEQAEAGYRRVDLANARLNAPIEIKQAEEAQRAARESVRGAEAELGTAQREYTDLVAQSEMLTKRGDTDEANLVRERAKEAKLRMEQLEKATDELRRKAAATIERAEKDIADAQQILETAPIKEATESARTKTEILKRAGGYGSQIEQASKGAAAAGSKRTALEMEIAGLQEQGATLGGGGYHPEREQRITELKSQLDQTLQTEADMQSTLSDYLAAKNRQDQQTRRDLQEQETAMRDIGPGG